MSLVPGTRLGPYEVIAPVGAGGMGEVFKARDTRLERHVAIKILPGEFAQNAQLRMRFEREAKTISQLSHPNICTLYDVGDGYLVMELLEGESLADRVAKGPLPINDVLKIGAQICDALDRAHKAGIVHRDLKPGNVMLTKSGAKLLDFGLAKEHDAFGGNVDATVQKPLTEEGTLVGTFQYMAPEQIEGAAVDARTDIFALGVLLYEMVTGRRAFSGRTKTSLIAAIVGGQPERISAVRPLAPQTLEAVILRALAKDPLERWQSALDLRWELLRIAGDLETPAERPRARSTIAWVAAAAATLLAAALAVWMVTRPKPAVAVTKFTFDVPQGWIAATELKSGPPAISPDGRSIVFIGTNSSSGRRFLWLRRIDDAEPKLLEGTEDACRPFWSPDSRSVAFFAENGNKLKRIDVSGGPARVICETPYGRGGAWGANDTILISPGTFVALHRVDARGGKPVPLTTLDAQEREVSHRWPSFLPDGKHFFYVARRINRTSRAVLQDRVYVADVETGGRKLILEASSNIQYVEPGYVVFVRDRALYAQPFDVRRLELEGDPVAIAPQVQFHPSGFGMFSASSSAVVYQAGNITAQLELLDRASERSTPVLEAADQYSAPRLSRDGQQILYDVANSGNAFQDLWLFDRRRKVARRMTNDPADDFGGVLSSDASRIYFSSNRSSTPQLYTKAVDGGEETLLQQHEAVAQFVQDLSADGRFLLYLDLGASQYDIKAISLSDRKTIPFAVSAFDELQPVFSPDGRFVAFASNESGQYEVYVAPFPSGTPHTQISIDGGTQPTWRGDGRELYFVGPSGRLMAVPIETGARVKAGEPSTITTVSLRPSRNQMREYDVSADGRTFLLNSTGSGRQSLPFTVVTNWTEGLKK